MLPRLRQEFTYIPSLALRLPSVDVKRFLSGAPSNSSLSNNNSVLISVIARTTGARISFKAPGNSLNSNLSKNSTTTNSRPGEEVQAGGVNRSGSGSSDENSGGNNNNSLNEEAQSDTDLTMKEPISNSNTTTNTSTTTKEKEKEKEKENDDDNLLVYVSGPQTCVYNALAALETHLLYLPITKEMEYLEKELEEAKQKLLVDKE